MKPMNEELLTAWLRLTTQIVNSRVVPDMTYNESLVCNILYNQRANGEPPLTATHLCKMTGMLKSQMNRTLTALENRGVIRRERSAGDKRQIFLWLNEESCAEYIAQHDKILRAIDMMIDRIGEDKARQAIEIFTLAADNADSLMAAHTRKDETH